MDKVVDYQNGTTDCADSASNAPGLQCDLPDASGTTLVPARPITLAELRPYAIKRRHQELATLVAGLNVADKAADKKSRQKLNHQVNQLSSVFKKITELAPQGQNTPASFALENAESWAEAEAKKGNRKYRQERDRLETYLREYEAGLANDGSRAVDAQVTTDTGVRNFAEVFAAAVKKSGHSLNSLAAKLEEHQPKFWKWATGEDTPRKFPQTVLLVREIEMELDAVGTLVELLDDAPGHEFAPDIPNDPKLRRRIRDAVGPTQGLSSSEVYEKQRAAVEEDKKKQAARLPDYGLGKNPECWPHLLLATFRRFVQVMRNTAEPRPDDPSHDPKRFYITCNDLGKEEAENIREGVPGKLRRVGSLESDANQFSLLFGWARCHIAPNQLSFAYLACPDLIRQYFRFHKERKEMQGEPALLTRRHIDLIHVSVQMLYLIAQTPEIADQYRPIDGLISAADAQLAKQDWSGACDRAIEQLNDIYEKQKSRTAASYNDEVEIAGMLDSDEPLDGEIAIARTLKKKLDRLPRFEHCRCDKQLAVPGIPSWTRVNAAAIRCLDFWHKFGTVGGEFQRSWAKAGDTKTFILQDIGEARP